MTGHSFATVIGPLKSSDKKENRLGFNCSAHAFGRIEVLIIMSIGDIKINNGRQS